MPYSFLYKSKSYSCAADDRLLESGGKASSYYSLSGKWGVSSTDWITHVRRCGIPVIGYQLESIEQIVIRVGMKVQEYCSLAEYCIMQKQEEKIAKRERPHKKRSSLKKIQNR